MRGGAGLVPRAGSEVEVKINQHGGKIMEGRECLTAPGAAIWAGERTRLACLFRRPAETFSRTKKLAAEW